MGLVSQAPLLARDPGIFRWERQGPCREAVDGGQVETPMAARVVSLQPCCKRLERALQHDAQR
jgi:hypothetical protein